MSIFTARIHAFRPWASLWLFKNAPGIFVTL